MKNGNDPYEEIKAEFERKVSFLLENQATTDVRLQMQEETMSKLEESNRKHDALLRQIMLTGRRIALTLSRAHRETEAQIKETQVQLKELAEAQKHTDYKINALIDAHLKLMEAQNRNDRDTDEIFRRQGTLEDQFRKHSDNPE